MNECYCMGNLGRDPVVKCTQTGKTYARFSIGCSEKWGDKEITNCKEKTDFTLTSVDRYCPFAIGKDSSHLIANGVAHTLTAYDYKAQQAVLKRGEAFVRRLTPLECERLQGLPDNWTEGGSDSKRYKAIGNGMAQPCADFVIEKLTEALRGGNE